MLYLLLYSTATARHLDLAGNGLIIASVAFFLIAAVRFFRRRRLHRHFT